MISTAAVIPQKYLLRMMISADLLIQNITILMTSYHLKSKIFPLNINQTLWTKLPVLHQVNSTYSCTKSLKNDDPVTWNNFDLNINNNNFHNVEISKF